VQASHLALVKITGKETYMCKLLTWLWLRLQERARPHLSSINASVCFSISIIHARFVHQKMPCCRLCMLLEDEGIYLIAHLVNGYT
jgi:hypothetical protein